MPDPKRRVAIHFIKVLKYLDLPNFSQNEPLASFSHLIHATLEHKHSH